MDSLDTIKFIGHQHAFLTDIMEQINFCYSFKVWYTLLHHGASWASMTWCHLKLSFWNSQMMINAATTFMLTVISLYVYCQCISKSEDFFVRLPWITAGWLVLHLSGILIVINYASLLTREGRKTFRIVHDIVNCCNDSDIIQSVNWFFLKKIQNMIWFNSFAIWI